MTTSKAKAKRRKRKPKWLRRAKRGPLDINVLDRPQIVDHLLHSRCNNISPLATRITVLTDEKLRKNRKEHPDMDGHYDKLVHMIHAPDHVAREPGDSQIAILYGEFSGVLYRAVVWLTDDPENRANSVFSFRRCRWTELLSDQHDGNLV